jgi:hypothetical protein
VTVALYELHEWLVANYEPFRRSCCIDIAAGSLSKLRLTRAELATMRLSESSAADEGDATVESGADETPVVNEETIVQWDIEAVQGRSRMAFIYCLAPPRTTDEEPAPGDDASELGDFSDSSTASVVGRLRLNVLGCKAHAKLRAAISQLREVRAASCREDSVPTTNMRTVVLHERVLSFSRAKTSTHATPLSLPLLSLQDFGAGYGEAGVYAVGSERRQRVIEQTAPRLLEVSSALKDLLRSARDQRLAHERAEKAPFAEPDLPVTFAMVNAIDRVTNPSQGALMQPEADAEDDESEAQRAMHAWLRWTLLYR